MLQIPRFAFEKFPGSKAELTTQMKSVGEAMAIGRTFQVRPCSAHHALPTVLDFLGLGLMPFSPVHVAGQPPAVRSAACSG